MNKPVVATSSFNRVPQLPGATNVRQTVSVAPTVRPAVMDLLSRRNIKGMLPVIPKGIARQAARTDAIKELAPNQHLYKVTETESIVGTVVAKDLSLSATVDPKGVKTWKDTTLPKVSPATKKAIVETIPATLAVIAKKVTPIKVVKANPVAKKEVAKKPAVVAKAVPKKVVVSKLPAKVSKVPQKKSK